jgi:uncharacterized protein
VLEAPDGRVVALEVKSTSAPDRSDARHLLWLRDRLDEELVCGTVLHTGPTPFVIGERIHAPISAIWRHR